MVRGNNKVVKVIIREQNLLTKRGRQNLNCRISNDNDNIKSISVCGRHFLFLFSDSQRLRLVVDTTFFTITLFSSRRRNEYYKRIIFNDLVILSFRKEHNGSMILTN